MKDKLAETGQRYFEIYGDRFVDNGKHIGGVGSQRWFSNPGVVVGSVSLALIPVVTLTFFIPSAMDFIQGRELTEKANEGLVLGKAFLGLDTMLVAMIGGFEGIKHFVTNSIERRRRENSLRNFRQAQRVFLFPS